MVGVMDVVSDDYSCVRSCLSPELTDAVFGLHVGNMRCEVLTVVTHSCPVRCLLTVAFIPGIIPGGIFGLTFS